MSQLVYYREAMQDEKCNRLCMTLACPLLIMNDALFPIRYVVRMRVHASRRSESHVEQMTRTEVATFYVAESSKLQL